MFRPFAVIFGHVQLSNFKTEASIATLPLDPRIL